MTLNWFDRSHSQGRLELTDRDRLDLLHRMSANDLASLQPGEGCSTALTTALARIIDRLIVYHRGDVALLIANYPSKVRSWLQKHIFFQDKVRLRDVSADLAQLELQGLHASELIEALVPGATISNLPLHHFVEGTFGGERLLIARTFPLAGEGFTLIVPNAALYTLKAALQDHAAVERDDTHYEELRIQAGLPGAGHELTEDYIPLEANLWDSVSFSKGCYIGQEIIARMESRNRLARTLVSLRLNAPVPAGAALEGSEGQRGIVTSVATIEDGTHVSVVGLGFVKPELAAVGAQFGVMVDGHSVGQAEITPLALNTRREEHPL
ncbi:MAG TPA: hypothetical protein VKQ72_12885 [Aggregatilineales bacterium]|nr:hypothetical protein [Aggregatilineales bacterium]